MEKDSSAELLQVMKDIRFLLRVQGRHEIELLVAEAFEDSDQRKAFKLLSEDKSYREIAAEIGPSRGAVVNWVKKWRALGLIGPDGTVPRIDPEMLGI